VVLPVIAISAVVLWRKLKPYSEIWFGNDGVSMHYRELRIKPISFEPLQIDLLGNLKVKLNAFEYSCSQIIR
jgi:hypothetical protein